MRDQCGISALPPPPARAVILEVSVYDISVSNKYSASLGFGLYHTGEVACNQSR